MEIPDGHFRHILLFTPERVKTHCKPGKSFRSGDLDLKDTPRSGRPTEVDDDKIKAMIENNRHSTTRDITEKIKISHTSIERHLKQLGYVNKLDNWVPHKLNEIQLTKTNFHLRFTAETYKNRSIFKANHNKR